MLPAGRVLLWSLCASLWAAPAVAQPASPAAAAEALWDAARKGDAAAVDRLLDHGVDVNTPFRYGATALSYACDRGHLEVVRVLLKRGANPNVADTFYKATPLDWASSPAQTRRPEHAAIVGLLLAHGAQGADRALMAATGEGDVPMVAAILAHGPLPAEVLADALETAQKSSNAALVAALETGGAKPHPRATLSDAQLARCAGVYSNGQVALTFEIKGGKLQGGPPGASLVLVPRDERTFGVEGTPGLRLVFAPDQERASTVTVNQRGTAIVYKRVEGK